VDDDVLKNARPVAVTVIPSEHEQTQTTPSIQRRGGSSLYVRIDKGVKAVGGFSVARDV